VLSPSGTLFVGAMDLTHVVQNGSVLSGVANVHALRDEDGDFKADKVLILLSEYFTLLTPIHHFVTSHSSLCYFSFITVSLSLTFVSFHVMLLA
jgi:hypothetical protein